VEPDQENPQPEEPPFLSFLTSDWDAGERHLCARCGMPVRDPLEECTTCASGGGEEEGWP
jgi:hypothetical protein